MLSAAGRARGSTHPDRSLLLAGDVGATETALGVFSLEGGPCRPLASATFVSASFPGLEDMAGQFLVKTGMPVERACLGVAGPVIDGTANITNLPWSVSEHRLIAALGLRSACLVNDLVATAEAVPFLAAEDILVLSKGEPPAHGALAVVAPGTGLGEAFLTWEGENYKVHASEGGHCDFAPANPQQLSLLHHLWASFEHVSFERTCSGLGLPGLRDYLKETRFAPEDGAHVRELEPIPDPTRLIIEAALADKRRCPLCAEAVALFAEILAAEAANLALKVMATGGVYLAGGLPARIVPVLQEPRFLAAFWRKGRASSVVRRMPVKVLLNPRAALIGAARRGLDLADVGAGH
jgi:glucokinase